MTNNGSKTYLLIRAVLIGLYFLIPSKALTNYMVNYCYVVSLYWSLESVIANGLTG